MEVCTVAYHRAYLTEDLNICVSGWMPYSIAGRTSARDVGR